MLKVYEEHAEFDRFTAFDTQTGRLSQLTEKEFLRYLPQDACGKRGRGGPHRVAGRGATAFLGENHPTHVRFPRRIYFQITRNCNLNCEYCFIKAKRGFPDVPAAAVMDVAAFMGDNGLMEVRLTGGEPTLHPDFVRIVRGFKERGVYVSVATNGIWSKKIFDALCTENGLWVICSVDGTRETHNRYRPGTFDTIIRNLKQLKHMNPSVRVRLTTVLTQENKREMFPLGEICASVGAESITVIPLRPQVRIPEIREQMVCASDFKGVIEDLIKAKQQFGIPFTTTMETDYKDEVYRDPIVRKKSSCAAGREAANLDYDADREEFLVYACSYSPASDLTALPAIRAPFLAGTFPANRVDCLLNIWRDEAAWRIYRDLSIRSASCKSCHYLARNQCTGSCPIQNIDYSKIDVGKDVLSQLKDQITRTGEWYCYQRIFG